MLSEQQQRILGYFIEEAKDHLNTIEQGLLNLQSTIEDPELVSEVFRAAHSVKGGAAMLGLNSIQKTAHRLEDYFKVLKDCPIQIDQKLETLLLEVFDALKELLEQLQGPFGLTDDKATEVMSGVEPVFGSLNQHLSLLVSQSGSAPPEDVELAVPERVPVAAVPAAKPAPQPVTSEESALQLIFQSDVPARLRDMLQFFKQEAQPAVRQQLEAICQSLIQAGEQFEIPTWVDLVTQAKRAIASPDHTFRTLAPIIIKDIKQAQELVLAGRTAEIAPSAALQALIPPEPEFDLAELESFDVLMGAPTPSDELFAELNLEAEPLTAASSQPDEELSIDWLSEGTFVQSEAADSVLASGDELADALGFSESLETPETEAGVFATQDGPEVGAAELNSLADLFEAEAPDLGLDWQDEDVLLEPDASLPEPLEIDATNDFSDLLLGPEDLGGLELDLGLTADEDEDLSGLLNNAASFIAQPSTEDESPFSMDDFLAEPTASSTEAGELTEANGLDDLGDFLSDLDVDLSLNAASEPADSALPLGNFESLFGDATSDQEDFLNQIPDTEVPESAEPQPISWIDALDSEEGLEHLETAPSIWDDSQLDDVTSDLWADTEATPKRSLTPPSSSPQSDVIATPTAHADNVGIDLVDLSAESAPAAPSEVTTSADLADLETDLGDLGFDFADLNDESAFTAQSEVTASELVPDELGFDFADLNDVTDSTEVTTPELVSDELGFDFADLSDVTGSTDSTDNFDALGLDEVFGAATGLVDEALELEAASSDMDAAFDFDLAADLSAEVPSSPENLDSNWAEASSNELEALQSAPSLTSDNAEDLSDLLDEESAPDAPLSRTRELERDLDFDALDAMMDNSDIIFSGGDESLTESEAPDLTDFDVLLSANDATSEPLQEASAPFSDLSDLDALLNEGLESGESTSDDLSALDAFLEDDLNSALVSDIENDITATFDDFDALDDLLGAGPMPETESAAATSELDDFSSLESLLNEPSPQPVVPSSSDHGSDNDDFSDLEALLDDHDGPPTAPSVIASTSPADTSSDDEFEDLEKLLEAADKTLGGSPTIRGVRGSAAATRRPTRTGGVLSDQTMRVSVKNLDNLNNLVGELVVNRNSLEQAEERLRQFLDNLLYQVQQLSDVGQRMRDLYERSLLESSLLSSRRNYQTFSPQSSSSSAANHATGLSFDALEMDRFTGFHTLSQEMIELIVRVRESASDINFVVDDTDQITRNFRQITTQLQEGLTRSRMVPFAQTADRLPRAVRDISVRCGKQAELVIEGRETLIDKMILEQLYDPMTHLVNNAITHGIETPDERNASGKPPVGRITVRAFHQGNQTVISVTDDGAGIDPERVKTKAIEKGLITLDEAKSMSRLDVYDLLFHHGFSTRDRADDFAGRGVGMDVVRTSLNEIRGVINIDSAVGRGTTFTIRLPLTLSISKALCCISNRARIAFPMDGVEDMLDVPQDRIQTSEDGQTCIQWRDQVLPFQPLSNLLKFNRSLGRGSVYGGNQEDDMISVVVLRSNAGSYLALQVDQVLGEQEIVIKQLEGPVPKPLGIAGATVLGDGRIMPIADVLELIDLSQGRIRREAGSSIWEKSEEKVPDEAAEVKSEPTVLIVDDSITVRELLSMTFHKIGYRVEQARDGQEAWEKLRSGLPCDLVFCDIEMPRMDGLELLSRLQKDPHLNNIPIAMLTSRGADRHRQMAVQLGAKGYFTKPYLEEVLLDAAQRMLKGEVLVSSASSAAANGSK